MHQNTHGKHKNRPGIHLEQESLKLVIFRIKIIITVPPLQVVDLLLASVTKPQEEEQTQIKLQGFMLDDR